jgi:hypothetical protein
MIRFHDSTRMIVFVLDRIMNSKREYKNMNTYFVVVNWRST